MVAVSSHAPPFFCPYCGEEDIRPLGERHGEWACGSCRRAWALRSILAPERTEVPDPGPGVPVAGAEVQR
jgi:ribosomal protein L37AE/L43A